MELPGQAGRWYWGLPRAIHDGDSVAYFTGVGPRGITGTGRKIVLGCLCLPSEIFTPLNLLVLLFNRGIAVRSEVYPACPVGRNYRTGVELLRRSTRRDSTGADLTGAVKHENK